MAKRKLNSTEARQGEKGTPVLMILVVALALCALVFVGLGVYGWWLPDADVAVEGPVPTGASAPETAPAGGTVAPGDPTTPQ
jgi:hypothetical protein